MIMIKSAEKQAELAIAVQLFKDYAAELNENLCFQGFDEELRDPLKKYGGPHGSLLLAYSNNEIAGCVALQAVKEPGVCEMKRLYVQPRFRKHGVGDALVNAILQKAKELGYHKMVLDTLERLQPAIVLYNRHGFQNTTAYYENPLHNVVYMERSILSE